METQRIPFKTKLKFKSPKDGISTNEHDNLSVDRSKTKIKIE